MGDTGVDIDLYADVEEFPPEELEQESNDLYDDVLASADKDDKVKKEADSPVTTGAPGSATPTVGSSSQQPPGRRYQLYVGNLTWWTTDQDIQNAIEEVSI